MGLFFSIGVAQEESNLFNEMPSRAVESVKNWKFVFQIKGYLQHWLQANVISW